MSGPAAADLETIRFRVTGMTCVSCTGRITRALGRLEGVRRVDVDLRRETATVVRERASVSDASLAAAVARAGYQADVAAAELLSTVRRRSRLDLLLRRTS